MAVSMDINRYIIIFNNYKAMTKDLSKDSMGNPLPKGQNVTNINDLSEALAMNTFILACKMHMAKGNTVIYDKDSKSATIYIGTSSHKIYHL